MSTNEHLYGTFPFHCIANLSQLKTLRLENSGDKYDGLLSGTVTQDITSLTNLQTL